MNCVEEVLGIDNTKNDKDEFQINFKVNKFGSLQDAQAHAMIKYLKEKNINLSKHIRLLLALEYQNAQALVGNCSLDSQIPFSYADKIQYEEELEPPQDVDQFI